MKIKQISPTNTNNHKNVLVNFAGIHTVALKLEKVSMHVHPCHS